MPNHFIVNRIIRKAAQKPLAIASRCRSEMVRLEAGYHQRLHDVVVGAYASAWHIRKKPGEWKKFLAKPFWKKAKTPKGDKGIREELHRVMMYVCDAISDQAYDRAYKYARVLEPYLVEGVQPVKVRQRIESDGGLEELYDRAKKQIPLRKGGGMKPDDQEWNDDDLTVGVNDDELEGALDEPKSDEGSNDPTRRQRLTLEVEISPQRLDRVFGMSRGQEGILRFKALSVEGDWHRFRATKLMTSTLSGNGSRASGSLRHVGNGSEITVPRRSIDGELAP